MNHVICCIVPKLLDDSRRQEKNITWIKAGRGNVMLSVFAHDYVPGTTQETTAKTVSVRKRT
jgi:hypothetical protein